MSSPTPSSSRQRWWEGGVIALPLLAVLYSVLSAYTVNKSEVALAETLRPTLILLAAVLVVGLLLWPLALPVGRLHRVCQSLFIFVLGLFAYEFLEKWSTEIASELVIVNPYLTTWPEHRLAQVLWAPLTLLLVVLPLRWKRETRAATPPLLLAALSLIGFLVPTLLHHSPSSIAVTATPPPTAVVPSSPAPTELPDLYCIILDGYGRADMLERFFGVDNAPFLQELEKRGFFIPKRSRANYIQTGLAVSSALNLDYLRHHQGLDHSLEDATDRIDQNRIRAILKPKGFRFVSVPCGVSIVATQTADVTLDSVQVPPPPLGAFERLLIAKTPLIPVLNNAHKEFDYHRARLESTLRHLPEAAALPYPKFVFAHVLAPHPPFVWGAAGEPVYPNTPYKIGDATDYTNGSSRQNYLSGYTNQLRGLNGKLLKALDAMQQSGRPKVIVLMGDHGPRSQTDWRSLKNTNTDEALHNLVAVATPDGKAEELLGETVTPINVFRLILTRYYGQNFPRLPDRSYYSTLAQPYLFTDVTDTMAP